jgi:hypothetical protein
VEVELGEGEGDMNGGSAASNLPECHAMPLTEGRVKRRFRLVIPWVSDVFLLQLFDKRSPTPKTPKKNQGISTN